MASRRLNGLLCLGHIATDNGEWSSEIYLNDAVIIFNYQLQQFLNKPRFLAQYFS